MRKLSAVAVGILLNILLSSASSATSVNLVWTGTAGGISAVSGSAVTVSSTQVATLTLDVQFDVDSRGITAAFLGFDFDTDFGNELNLLDWEELSWEQVNSKGVTLGMLGPLMLGLDSTIESTDTQAGTIFEFDGVSLSPAGALNTTLTFARIVFTTNPGNIVSDGGDVFNSQGQGLVAAYWWPPIDITSSVIFGIAAVNVVSEPVNVVPEPGTLALVGLGVTVLVLASRRDRA